MIKIGKMMTVFSIVSLLVVGVSLWAQQQDANSPGRQPRARPRPEKVVQTTPKAHEPRKSGPPHVLEPPDLLLVEVLEALPGRPISGERLVRPDGTISLGFYGDVHVAGLTLPEVKEKIVLHLQRYLTDACLGLVETDPETMEPVINPNTKQPLAIDPKDTIAVFVDVTAYNSRYYYIEGEVSAPGRIAFTGNENILDVIYFVGGLLPSADRSKIRLVRSYPKGSPVQVLPIDYEEITMGTDSSTNYQILPNDRLVIPRVPDYKSSDRQSVRSQQTSPSAPAGGAYFSRNASADQESKQLEALRSIEKHLGEVETKLDRIIKAMDGGKKKEGEIGPDEPATEPDPKVARRRRELLEELRKLPPESSGPQSDRSKDVAPRSVDPFADSVPLPQGPGAR